MKKVLLLSVSFLVLSGSVSLLRGLGTDHPHPVIKGDGGWADAYYKIFNRPDRVHGFFVNSGDVFFYAGNTKAFNEFLVQCSVLEDISFKLILHVGRQKARSPWDKEDRDIAIDWRLYVDRRSVKKGEGRQPFIGEIDLWLGGSVKLAEVKVPINILVTSGGEIQDFIAEHEKKRVAGKDK